MLSSYFEVSEVYDDISPEAKRHQKSLLKTLRREVALVVDDEKRAERKLKKARENVEHWEQKAAKHSVAG